MTTRVLVPYDGSEQADAALDHALTEFAAPEVVVLHVIDPAEVSFSAGPATLGGGEEWYEEAQAAAEELFEQARAAARKHEVDLETATELGRPSRTIVEFAEENDIDHVVMGSHGRSGVSRILLGSVAETVVRRSPVPVTVVR